jgi:hypothetical protein
MLMRYFLTIPLTLPFTSKDYGKALQLEVTFYSIIASTQIQIMLPPTTQ